MAGKTVKLGAFTAFEPNLTGKLCRLGSFIRPTLVDLKAITFDDIPRLILTQEFTAASALDEKAPVVLTGYLKSLSFSSMSGTWEIGLDIMSSNGKSLSVAEKYDFGAGYFRGGESACNHVQQALGPAMQELVSKIFADPAFPALLEAKN
jgi:hypothetical protein